MYVVKIDSILHAAPSRVWAALIDFENYALWNPFVRIIGKADSDSYLKYSFRLKPQSKWHFKAKARISQFVDDRLITFTYGIRGILVIEESYAIIPMRTGCCLTHTLLYHGILSRLNSKTMQLKFYMILEIIDRQFRTMFAPTRPSEYHRFTPKNRRDG
jgi:hypothetical protein